MTLTTTTNVSVDGVMAGRTRTEAGGFERDGWALPLFANEAEAYVGQIFQRADAFLFGRRTYEIFAPLAARQPACRRDHSAGLVYPLVVGEGTWLFPAAGPDTALDLVDARSTPSGITVQVYRPQYATA